MNGAKEVGMPINKILAGVFDVLTFESVSFSFPVSPLRR